MKKGFRVYISFDHEKGKELLFEGIDSEDEAVERAKEYFEDNIIEEDKDRCRLLISRIHENLVKDIQYSEDREVEASKLTDFTEGM